MKKLLLVSAAALALSASSAFAADLAPVPYYKAPPPPPPISWTGCYVYGGVGYGMWNQDHYAETDPGSFVIGTTTTSGGQGWLGRIGGGCDYQVAPRWVIGAFADYDFMSVKGTFSDPTLPAAGSEKELGSWAAGGRIGYLVTPSLLTYVEGGWTQARFSQIDFVYAGAVGPPVPFGFDVGAHNYNGWFLGGGTEYALSGIVPIHGLFWRTEYRYASYQAAELPIVVTATGVASGVAEHMQKDVQTITSGLVWRFNFGGAPGPGY